MAKPSPVRRPRWQQARDVRAVGPRRFAVDDLAVPGCHPRMNSSGVTKCSYEMGCPSSFARYSATPLCIGTGWTSTVPEGEVVTRTTADFVITITALDGGH